MSETDKFYCEQAGRTCDDAEDPFDEDEEFDVANDAETVPARPSVPNCSLRGSSQAAVAETVAPRLDSRRAIRPIPDQQMHTM